MPPIGAAIGAIVALVATISIPALIANVVIGAALPAGGTYITQNGRRR
jgi:hypothetical protein